ncbi:hypothetical protein TIFTF001_007127 [Ficus carica]|uniref:PUM-HD domain-containing protein n=1 Tax=Ficus carica TaxID=3494 RepID=A0AA88D1M1_FICCA|nr:hypothetical protein TIFTF001_007127 [Ficus carica]
MLGNTPILDGLRSILLIRASTTELDCLVRNKGSKFSSTASGGGVETMSFGRSLMSLTPTNWVDLLVTDGRLAQICADEDGTKVVQKLVESVRLIEQKAKLASALTSIALLLYEIAENCLDIAQDEFGFSILQRCFDEAEGENFDLLADPTVQHADTLSENAYAYVKNYVVQHLIQMRKWEVNRSIVERFRGKFVSMSMNKYGSNVVEKLVKSLLD